MKDVLQGVLLFVALTFVAVHADADELGDRLAQLFVDQDAQFIAYETIDSTHSPNYGNYQYLVMDFMFQASDDQHTQGAVHAICSSLLKDIGLVTELSHRGFQMVSVSFDRNSQYDCL